MKNDFFYRFEYLVWYYTMCQKPHTNRIIRSLLRTHFVKPKHIKMRMDIDEFLSLLNIYINVVTRFLTRHLRYTKHGWSCPSSSIRQYNFIFNFLMVDLYRTNMELVLWDVYVHFTSNNDKMSTSRDER